MPMDRPSVQGSFPGTTWRRWLDRLRQADAAMDLSEIDQLEMRVRALETQLGELRARLSER